MATLVRRILAPNPGPMTLDGTNTWVLRTSVEGPCIVVDPGPAIDSHLEALATLPVALIVVTHHHTDHTGIARALHERTGAPVRGGDAAQCIDAAPLVDGETLDVDGARARVVAAPGHTADSIALWLAEEGEHGAMLTGDTILGRGTTVIMHPDGSIRDYLATLDRLESFGDARVLPGHGDELPSLASIVRDYRAHRLERLEQVRDALGVLGEDAEVTSIADLVYRDADASVRPAAEASLRAQLEFLRA